MRSKRIQISIITLLACVSAIQAQDAFDDIYYNPKKSNTTTSSKSNKKSYYISDMGNMDVDAYNRRGEQYYVSSIDTIGSVVENGDDFVYTQQIQKYYNPTIVVDNANVLDDVLSNAYGNVDIIINNNGYPVFAPYNYYSWNWPYYTSVWSPWSWGISFGPLSWNIGWYSPWYSWNWGPAWGPGWGPGWWGPGPGPVWRPGPGGPGWGPGPRPMASWSPGGNRPAAPRPGWSASTQPRPSMGMHQPPVGNYNGGGNRGGNRVNGNMVGQQSPQRPGGVVNNNGKWEYQTPAAKGHRTGNDSRQINTGANRNNKPVVSTPSSPTKNNTNVNHRNSNTNSKSSGNVRSNNKQSSSQRSSVSNSRTSGSSMRSTAGASRGSSSGRSSGGGSRGGGGGRHR